MSYTDTRKVIQEQLAAVLGIQFVGGRIDGPVEDRTVGCCWIGRISHGDDIVVQYADVGVRVFRQWKQNTAYVDGSAEQDDLEALALEVQQALATIKTSAALQATGAWFLQDMPQIELDPAASMVDTSVTVAFNNPFIN